MSTIPKLLIYTVSLSLLITPTTYIKAAAELPGAHELSEKHNMEQSESALYQFVYDSTVANYQKQLITAVSRNDNQCVRGILSHAEEHDITTKKLIDSTITNDGDPLLHVAVRHQDGTVALTLLSCNANPNIEKPNEPHKGKVALHGAAVRGTKAVESLLAYKANIEALCPPDLQTPLILAAQAKKEKTVETLLTMGANPNAQNINGNTALHCVVEKCDQCLTTLLLQHGASLNIHNNNRQRPQDIASAPIQKAIGDFLREQTDICRGIRQLTPARFNTLMRQVRDQRREQSLLQEKEALVIVQEDLSMAEENNEKPCLATANVNEETPHNVDAMIRRVNIALKTIYGNNLPEYQQPEPQQ